MSAIGPIGGGYSALVQQAAVRRAGAASELQTKVSSAQSASGIAPGRTHQALGAPSIPAANGLDNVLSTVREASSNADRMVVDLASGRDLNIHNTMVELEKADIALKYTVQLRNRALSAYEELMRMQI